MTVRKANYIGRDSAKSSANSRDIGVKSAFGVELFGVIGRKGWKAVGFLKYLGFGVKIAKN